MARTALIVVFDQPVTTAARGMVMVYVMMVALVEMSIAIEEQTVQTVGLIKRCLTLLLYRGFS